MLQTKHKTLVIEGAPALRYQALPGLDVADYIQDHIERFSQTGVLDYLSISGSGIDMDSLQTMDLSAISVVAQAFARVLSTDGGAKPQMLRAEIIDHCERFKVQIKIDGADEWQALNVDALNEHLAFEQMAEIVKTLAGEVLLPLWRRLVSSGGARQAGSATSSLEPSKDG